MLGSGIGVGCTLPLPLPPAVGTPTSVSAAVTRGFAAAGCGATFLGGLRPRLRFPVKSCLRLSRFPVVKFTSLPDLNVNSFARSLSRDELVAPIGARG